MAGCHLRREDYTVGWVCALPVELAAAQEMLDEEHQDLPQNDNDSNIYTLGRIGKHHVVIACLPEGQMGNNSAAAVAVQMKLAFTSIRFGLMVGIGGGVPSEEVDIRLGDVVVNRPHKVHGGVVQYDFGKTTPSGFERTGFLNTPPTILLNAVAKLRANHMRGMSRLSEYVFRFDSLPTFTRKDAEPDVLFQADYDHEGGATCEGCSKERVVDRHSLRQEVVVHYGTIASGNRVMRDAAERDRVSAELGGVLCFEMEAAGLMNNFPCLVIRGICDYADSHKNKKWQAYAAGTAAACAKEVLSVIPPAEVAKARTVDETTTVTSDRVSTPCHDHSIGEPCLRTFRAFDPVVEKDKIELNKDKLLKECYSWILHNPDFRRWTDSEKSKLLWIKGDPGTGKTMIMIALAEELSRQSKAESDTIAGTLIGMARRLVTKRRSCIVSYFFCQSTDYRLNSATSVLKGLIYLLVTQERGMIQHVRKRFDDGGSRVFEGSDAVYNLRLILRDILDDPALPRTYLLIDALDECNEGLQQLLDTITDEKFIMKPKVKWLVASRNRPDVAERLRPDDARMKISLELNPEHITKAVNAYIDSKVRELTLRKKYDLALEEEVRRTLSNRSEATFLWVALACKTLEKEPVSEAQSILENLPAGLDAFYDRMMNQIFFEPDSRAEHCKQILRSAAVAYRPLRLQELAATTELPDKILDNVQHLSGLVERCGSFLTLRGETIFFIHQSAKDYLTSGNGRKLLSWDQAEEHGKTTIQSLNILSKILKRDICSLKNPGTLTSEVGDKVVKDALLRVEYACCYWVYHLSGYLVDLSHARLDKAILSDGGIVHTFLLEHLLHWLEALSLLRRLSEGVAMTRQLLSVIYVAARDTNLFALVQDAYRFVFSSRAGIELAPLQVYSSALIFAPQTSIVRKWFSDQIPDFFYRLPVVGEGWSSLLQTLDDHSDWVWAVAFSPDGKVLASASHDKTIKLWDADSGAVLQTLDGHSDWVRAVAFSPDGKVLASASQDKTVKLWDAGSGAALQTLHGHSNWVNAVAFSPDSKVLASTSDKTVKLWDAGSGAALQTLHGHSNWVNAVAFSPDGKMLASASHDKTVKLWDTGSGASLQTLHDHWDYVHAVAFSPDGKVLASASHDKTIKLWDAGSGAVLQTLDGHSDWVRAVAFSPDGKVLASASHDKTVKLWDANSKASLRTLDGHSNWVNAVAFSPDGKVLASASQDKTVKLWDTGSRASPRALYSHSNWVNAVAFSPDGKVLASASQDKTVKLWDAGSRASLRTLHGHGNYVHAVAFSPDGKVLASASRYIVELWDTGSGTFLQTLYSHWDVHAMAFSPDGKVLASVSHDKRVKRWDASSGKHLLTLHGHSDWVNAIAFSPDGKVLASASQDKTVRLWDARSGAAVRTLYGHLDWVIAIAFSPDGKVLASASQDKTVKLWDAGSGAALQTLHGHSNWVNAVAFSPDGMVLASVSGYMTVKLWDISSGAVLQTLKAKAAVRSISFSDDGTSLKTNNGLLHTTPLRSGVVHSRRYIPPSIFIKGQWVARGVENMLWLPPDYRPSCTAICGTLTALGHASGQVSILEVL